MQTRRLGSLKVSIVGLGCNNFGGRLDATATADVVSAAIEAGITLFDTADIYGGTQSEVLLGQALGDKRDSFSPRMSARPCWSGKPIHTT